MPRLQLVPRFLLDAPRDARDPIWNSKCLQGAAKIVEGTARKVTKSCWCRRRDELQGSVYKRTYG